MSEQQEDSHLDDFSDSFFVKCILDQMISRYMLLAANFNSSPL